MASGLSISLRSDVKSKDGNHREVTVEIPLAAEQRNQIKIATKGSADCGAAGGTKRTFLIREDNQLDMQDGEQELMQEDSCEREDGPQ